MSYNLDIRYRVANDQPSLMWVNRHEVYQIGSSRTSHSGRVALVKKATVQDQGRPMLVNFRMARKSHIDAWTTLAEGSDPFNTTSLATYFSTGKMVIFSIQNPITIRNEIIQTWDINQDIFDSSSGNYRAGFNWWAGTLSLIITGSV